MIDFKKIKFLIILLILTFSLVFNMTLNSTEKGNPNYKSNQSSTRSDQWIQDLQDNFDNPQWFYDNLNANDRKKIRQALDFAIPRQEIIDSILDGHGFLLATTVVPQTGPYYDPSFVPRTLNPSRSIELLTEVFGYEYGSDDNSTTPYDESLNYFRMVLSTPVYVFSLWEARVSFNYLSIGVDIVYKQWTWTTIFDRILDNPGYEKSYDNGGFDGQFIGWGTKNLPGDRSFFHSESLAPNGTNYQGVNNQYMDDLIDLYDKTKNITERIEAYNEFQDYFYDNALKNILFQSELVYGLDINTVGFNPYFGSSIQYQNITIGNQTSMVISMSGEINEMNSFISDSRYDKYMLGSMWKGLLTTSTPPGDMSFTNYQLYNDLAESWNKSADGLTYFFNLKFGLMFSDGSELNATDVKFSYDSILNETGEFPSYSDYARQLTPENITIINQTAVKFQLHEWGPFSDLTLFGLAILPSKVYTQIPINQWSQDGTNIDNSTIISNGAYEFVSLSNGVGILKNSSIFTPAYTAKFDNIPYNAYPILTNIAVILQKSAEVALTSLKNGEIDFIDSNLGLTSVFDQIKIGGTATYQTYYGESWQELGLNQASPIWGLDPIDPSLFSTSDSLSTSRDSISSEEISTGHTSVSSEKDFSSVLLDSFIVIIWGSSLFIVGAIIANVVKKE